MIKPVCKTYSNGSKTWTLDGFLHSIGEPAIIHCNGKKEWWIHGKKYSFEEYLQKLKELGHEEEATNLLFQLDAV